MINVEVHVAPIWFKLVNGVVFIYGGVFKVDGDVLDLNNSDDIVFKCLNLTVYDCDYTIFPNVLCSRNLWRKK